MIKFRLEFDKEKEEVFLNEMCRQGHAAVKFCMGFYTFDECEPGKYIYRIDCSDSLGHVSESYRTFMKEMNVEIVFVWGPWVILRKEASEGEFDLYTDVDSQIENQKKIRKVFKIGGILEALVICYYGIAYSVTGQFAYIPLSLLISIILIAFIVEINSINKRINTLMEQKTGISQEAKQPGRAFIAAGCLLNACSLLLRDGAISDIIIDIIQVLAIVIMAVGIFVVCKERNESKEL